MAVPKHIALLSTDFRPMGGGVAEYLHRLADATASSLPVTVLTSVPQDGITDRRAYDLERLPPVPARRLHAASGDGIALVRKLRTGSYFLRLHNYGSRTITRVTSQWDGDAAVLIGIWDMAAHYWCTACRRARVPYHLFAYGAELVMPLYGRVPAWRARDFREASRVIACSRATAQLAVDRLQLSEPPAIVNPSVGPRPSASETAARERELRGRFALVPGRTIFSLGRLVARKGFDQALRGIAALTPAFPDLTYLVAGAGPERDSLEAIAGALGVASRVHFLGEVDELTKWAAYDACDVFLMPNRLLGGGDFEGFGIVLLEAALSGRAAVAGRNGGTGDAVVHGETGLLVDPESPGELTAALRRLLSDGRLREQLGRAGLERAATRFTSDAAAKSLRVQCGWA